MEPAWQPGGDSGGASSRSRRQSAPGDWARLAPAHAGRPGTTGYAMWRLSDGGSAVPQARSLVRGVLIALGMPPASVDDGELMACEITTNALRHASGPYELRLYAFQDAVVCEVLDGSAGSLELVRAALAASTRAQSDGRCGGPAWSVDDLDAIISDLAEGGRGLPLVGRLCAGRCGVRSASTVDSPPASGKAVWFTQTRPQPQP